VIVWGTGQARETVHRLKAVITDRTRADDRDGDDATDGTASVPVAPEPPD